MTNVLPVLDFRERHYSDCILFIIVTLLNVVRYWATFSNKQVIFLLIIELLVPKEKIKSTKTSLIF